MKVIKKVIRYSSLYRAMKMTMIKRSIGRWTKHDQEMFDFYGQFLKADDLCFDIGANRAIEPQDIFESRCQGGGC